MTLTPPTSLLADAPITDPTADRLGRAGFARALAASVLSLSGRDSVVIGIRGAWGSGKSSVLNLFLNELEKGGERKPLVVHFNPWWFSGQDRLLQAFLQQLGAVVHRVERDKGVKRASGLLGKLSAALKPMSLIPVIGDYVKIAQEAAAAASEVTKQYADALAADVQTIRAEINDLLGELPHRIVVVMDDIDRLTASEIGQLFAILKAVADFTNTVYVLAYDERVVRRAVRSTLGISGKAYLDKIVQLGIDLPTPDRTALHQLFLEQLQELLGDQPESASAETDFGNLFHDGLKHFLDTPRACKRLVNVLRFSLPPLRGEVYWPDAVAVGCLTAFAPQVVRVITTHPERFVGHSDLRSDQKTAKQFHSGWLEAVNGRDREAVQNLVGRLFPKFSTAFGGSNCGSDWEGRWREQLRVRSEAHFEKYFRLCIPSGTISEREWGEVIDLLESLDAFERRLVQMCGRAGKQNVGTQAKETLDRLQDFVKLRAVPSQASQVFAAVLNVGDALAIVEDKVIVGGLMPITNALRIRWLLKESLAKIADQTERVQVIEKSLERSVSIHTAAEFVRALGYAHAMYTSSHDAQNPSEPPLVPKEKVEDFAALVVQKIETAAADGSLAVHPMFVGVVRYWRLFGGAERATEWVRQHVETDENLVGIVRQIRSEVRSHSMSDRVATSTPHVDCNYLGEYLPVLEARRRCANLLATAPVWLTADDRRLLELVVASVMEDGTVHDRWRWPERQQEQPVSDQPTPSGSVSEQ